VNTYGVSDNENGTDTLNMFIYSDYLERSVKVPVFDVRDRDIVMFSDLTLPCINELIVLMIKDENKNQVASHNTIRVECGQQSVGYSQREFRFHNVALEQVAEALDVPVLDYFTKYAISLL